MGLSISVDKRFLATCSYDETACIWDLQTRTILHRIEHVEFMIAVAISSTNHRVLTQTLSNIKLLWDLHTGLPVQETVPSLIPAKQSYTDSKLVRVFGEDIFITSTSLVSC